MGLSTRFIPAACVEVHLEANQFLKLNPPPPTEAAEQSELNGISHAPRDKNSRFIAQTVRIRSEGSYALETPYQDAGNVWSRRGWRAERELKTTPPTSLQTVSSDPSGDFYDTRRALHEPRPPCHPPRPLSHPRVSKCAADIGRRYVPAKGYSDHAALPCSEWSDFHQPASSFLRLEGLCG
ncbi:hypothetical protein LX36DRAFT_662240 [Colletotrichum falcatum]|nr:hypothetical protein LX36DRAFT_662240 [Colletotrichum falcatum]